MTDVQRRLTIKHQADLVGDAHTIRSSDSIKSRAPSRRQWFAFLDAAANRSKPVPELSFESQPLIPCRLCNGYEVRIAKPAYPQEGLNDPR